VKTTTVRFDIETWDDIVRQSEALGISHAEFIRGAVHRRLGRLADADRLAALDRRLTALGARVDKLSRVVTRLATAIAPTRRP
jgi:hypothetical protein